MASRSRTQITGRPSAREAQFSEQQTAELTGLRRRVGRPVSFGAFLFLTQTTERRLVAMEPLCEQPMEETHGLAKQAGPAVPLLPFQPPRRTPVWLLVSLAHSSDHR